MKRKAVISALVALMLPFVLDAAPVDLNTAKESAKNFYNGHFKSAAKGAGDFVCIYPDAQAKGFIPYYIFNVGERNGFVIVSGDDNTTYGVLAYSDKGHFDMEAMPANVRYWLGLYEEGVRAASVSSVSAPKWREPYMGGEIVVAPLLGLIAYDQEAPYNRMCPEFQPGRKSATGCAATAMSVIARYYKYPAQGRGTINYRTSRYPMQITADLSTSVYDWENMLPNYGYDEDGNSPVEYTEQQADAVALLMRDAGYGMSMDYGESSGATIIETLMGAVEHFSYDSTAGLRYRERYDDEKEWIAMLKGMLDAGAPIYYSGQAKDGGHAFVFDGYDADDFFHVHWGWSNNPTKPSYDGFYRTNDLDPQGGGPGSYDGGYNRDQYIIYGMVPPEKRLPDAFKVDLYEALSCPALETEDELSSFTVSIRRLCNWNAANFRGDIALALYNENGELVQLISGQTSLSLTGILQTRSIYAEQKVITLEASAQGLEDGDYRIYVVTKSDMEGCTWTRCNASRSGFTSVSYLPVTVKSEKFTRRNIEHVLSVSIDIPISRNVFYLVFRAGVQVGNVYTASSSNVNRIKLLKDEDYTFKFYTLGFDTTTVHMLMQDDTAVTVKMKETMLPPYLYLVRVTDGVNVNFLWKKQAPEYNGKKDVNPQGYILYLDSVPVATAPAYTPAQYGTYVFKNLSKGEHYVGVRSVYLEDTTELVDRKVTITADAANEENAFGECRLSPNPSNGMFTLEVPCACKVEVCNLSGKVVWEKRMNNAGRYPVDLNGYASGVYMVRIYGENGKGTVLKAFVK